MERFLLRSLVLLLAVGFVVLMLVGLMFSSQYDWSIAGVDITILDLVAIPLALLPGLIILQHALDLRFSISSKPKFHIGQMPGNRQGVQDSFELLRPAYETAENEYRQARSFRNLMISYGLPAVFNVAAVIAIFYVARFPQRLGIDISDGVMHGVRLGALGAYVYVVLHLTQRYFQRDISTGGATWCAANLVLGPILGGLLAVIWKGNDNGDLTLAQAAVFFLAGLAPRFVADRLNDAMRRTFLSTPEAAQQSPRVLALTNVRGITTLIEDRFYEEGIFDVHGLAMANPFRLLSQTPFDKRQIVAWIDEALLMTVLPQYWLILQREGYTGAIDVATLAYADQTPGAAVPATVDRVAKLIKSDPLLFHDTVKRLYQDMQVRLIWSLYQSITAEDSQSATAPRP